MIIYKEGSQAENELKVAILAIALVIGKAALFSKKHHTLRGKKSRFFHIWLI